MLVFKSNPRILHKLQLSVMVAIDRLSKSTRIFKGNKPKFAFAKENSISHNKNNFQNIENVITLKSTSRFPLIATPKYINKTNQHQHTKYLTIVNL